MSDFKPFAALVLVYWFLQLFGYQNDDSTHQSLWRILTISMAKRFWIRIWFLYPCEFFKKDTMQCVPAWSYGIFGNFSWRLVTVVNWLEEGHLTFVWINLLCHLQQSLKSLLSPWSPSIYLRVIHKHTQNFYRGFSPYANFITANFITAIFQKNP